MKRTIRKRCLPLLLSVLLLVSGMPLTAFAQEDGADTELSSAVQPAEEVQLPQEDTEAAKEESGQPTEETGGSAEEAGQPIEEMDGSSEEPDQATGETGQAAEGQAQEGSATAAALDIMPASSTADVIDLSDTDAALVAASGGKYSYNAGTKVITIHSGPVTVTGSTTDRQVVVTGTTAVTLDNTTIDVSAIVAYAAISLQSGTNVTLILQGNNVLKSGQFRAGINVSTGMRLSIQGADANQTLAVTAGLDGAGIGGNSNGYFSGLNSKGGDITITGGSIEVTGSGGAGIGGGFGSDNGTVEISGGVVVAHSTNGGAGIGGGTSNSPSGIGSGGGGTINISGGVVTATGGNAAAIGGGAGSTTLTNNGNGGIITISGGTITATAGAGAGIGMGRANTEAGTSVTITGGSINASRVSPQPTNGAVPVYLNTLTVGNPGVGAGLRIANGLIDGVNVEDNAHPSAGYGIHNTYTDADSKVYFWLPQNSSGSAFVELSAEVQPTNVRYTKTWARTGASETQALLRKGDAAAPTIDTQPAGGTYEKGSSQSLSIAVSIADEGTLSYQWYENAANSNTGGAPVGTGSTYSPDTSTVGTKYYYCVVTSTNLSVAGTPTAAVTSEAAAVKIIAAPTVGSPITPPPVFVGGTLMLFPVMVTNNGDAVTAEGWEISEDGATGWTAFNTVTAMTYAHNGQILRYYATNSVGTGYSNRVLITVMKYTLTLVLTAGNITYGEAAAPILTGNSGSGAVTWEYKAQGTPDSGYSASVPVNAGSYTVRATVAETDTHNGGAATADFLISQAVPAMTLAATPVGGSLASDDVILRAELTGVSPTDSPTGTVTFKNGGTVLGTVPVVNGSAEYLWEAVPFGTYELTAEYAGDSNYENADSSISGYDVEKKTQAALEITGVPETVTYGDGSFDLGTTGGSGSGGVTYILQSGDAVSVSGNTVTIEKAGTAVLQAVKAADAVYNQIGATVTITVEMAEPGIVFTANPAGGSLASDDVTLTAEVTGVSPTDYPTGHIVFTCDGNVLDMVPVVNGVAEYLWEEVAFGTYDLRAQYMGDDNYESTDDSISGYEVEKKTQDALAITGVPETVTYGDGSFDLGTAGGSGDGGVTYTVQSGDAVSLVGNTVTVEKAGTAVLRAVKAADEVYNETAAVVTVTVKKAVPTVQENPAAGGANVGAKLSAVSLAGISVLGVDGAKLAGSFAWENPETVIQGAGKHTAVFIPDSANYEAVSFEVQVRLATEKPVITEIKATPKGTDGAVLEVTATGSTSLTYQWQVWGSWTDIPGATTAAYTYTGLAANTAYTVRVIVTDANGNSTTSQHITFQTGAAAITGLPGSYTLAKGSSVSWTPQPAGGTWKYDADYLTLSEKEGTATFTAKKVGKTTVTYTAGGTEFVITLTVYDSDSPKTGDDSSLGWYLVFGFAALCGLGVLAGLWNRRRKKEN